MISSKYNAAQYVFLKLLKFSFKHKQGHIQLVSGFDKVPALTKTPLVGIVAMSALGSKLVKRTNISTFPTCSETPKNCLNEVKDTF